MSQLQQAIVFFNQRQSLIRTVLVVLLSIYLIAYVAELTWRLIPAPTSQQSATASTNPATANTRSNNAINLNAIKRLNLFGVVTREPQAVSQEQVTDAPETRLNLTLTGVVATTEQQQGAAIIENKGNQQTYGIGEKIEGTNASLREVFNDRVIIKNGARNETLMLDGEDFEQANRDRSANRSVAAARPSSRQTSNQPRLSDEALQATQQLRNQPTSFTDFLSISPAAPDGQLVGYRVQPGKNPALFEAAGLQSGDIITEINGLDVTDPQQAREAMGELQSSESLQLTVLRNEQYLTLYLDLPEPDSEV